MHQRRPHPLTAPEFIVAITLLLANDFLLKPWLANAFTGKLSDFAGLFAFPFFWAAFAPRYRTSIYLGTAVAFTFWKLPASAGLIEAWNAVSPLQVGRVSDLSDLIALTVLPLSWWCSARPREGSERRWRTVVLAGISLFAFAATSRSPVIPLDQTFVFEGSQEELLARLKEAGIESFRGEDVYVSAPEDSWGLKIPSNRCADGLNALVMLVETGAQTEVQLRGMAHICAREKDEKEKLLEIFKSSVVEPLGMKPSRFKARNATSP